MRRSAARHVGAFRKACQTLKELYQKFNADPAAFNDWQPEFPHPRSYRSLDDEKEEVHFRYASVLEYNKLLFVAKTDAGEQVCIKFAQTYSVEAHRKCAERGTSPKLRGSERVVGGWHMVVMDLLEGYQCLHDVKHRLSDGEKGRLMEELRSKLAALHQDGLVHGDVRDANVMVRKEPFAWKLVDFDWSGRLGEVRYPMNINRGPRLRRPEGAVDGQLVLADHDVRMLDMLF